MLRPAKASAMGVLFYLDPAILDDRNLDDIRTVTLSYTLFRADETEVGALAAANGD